MKRNDILKKLSISKKHQNPLIKPVEEIILSVKNLTLTIDDETLLEGVSFDVHKGETTMFLGPNGAGKTTLFQALLGIRSYKGTIEWKQNVRIGYVPQRFEFDKYIPVNGHEFLALKTKGLFTPQKDYTELCKLVSLNPKKLKTPIGLLSTGERQRLLILWAIQDNPEVLLFDEPTSGVDVGAEKSIYELLHSLVHEQHLTLLMINHDLNIIYRYADKVVCVNKKLVCHGEPQKALTTESLQQLYGERELFYHPHGKHQ